MVSHTKLLRGTTLEFGSGFTKEDLAKEAACAELWGTRGVSSENAQHAPQNRTLRDG